MDRIVIIGGNAAGMSAAARAKRLRHNLAVTVVESSEHISYAICGSPYLISGEIRSAADLVRFTPDQFQSQRGAQILIATEALDIQTSTKKVLVRKRSGGIIDALAYDRLLLATGYQPVIPPIKGIEHPRVHTLARLENAMAVRQFVDECPLGSVLIVGGGYVGLELCEALRKRNVRVTLVERSPQVLQSLDPDMAAVVAREVEQYGVELLLESDLAQVHDAKAAGQVQVQLLPTETWREFQAVFLDVGVRPNVELAVRAGLQIGLSGAIEVSDRMETSTSGIYAAGNCAEVLNLVSGRKETSFLATTATKQGRVAGENLAGMVSRFPGVVGTSIVRVFNLEVGSVGLNTRQALEAGFRCDAVKVSAPAIADYLPQSYNITIKVLFDRQTGRLLGAQLLGTGGVAGRLNVLATCMTQRMTVEAAAQLDLCYAPHFSQVWDPIHVAMHAALRSLQQMPSRYP
jgi:NADPH-dependent 2,4-dienoyl-CoA reductase/sulfur reductase-like enzyme